MLCLRVHIPDFGLNVIYVYSFLMLYSLYIFVLYLLYVWKMVSIQGLRSTVVAQK